MKILSEKEQEALEVKAVQLISSGLWKGCVEVVISQEIEKLDDSWQNKEIEDLQELQLRKKILEWVKDIPKRLVQEAKAKKG